MVIFFFIGNLFYLIKARLSVYKSNFQKRVFFKVSIATSTAREDCTLHPASSFPTPMMLLTELQL
jgi:hypothetical protein